MKMTIFEDRYKKEPRGLIMTYISSCRFMHSLCKNENISLWESTVAA